jgi:hypothetical protein
LFKDTKLIKKKSVAGWEEEKKLQQYFIKTIQEIQAEDPLQNLIPKEKTQWSTIWARLLKFEFSTRSIIIEENRIRGEIVQSQAHGTHTNM